MVMPLLHDTGITQAMLEKGMSPNTEYLGHTALSYAASMGRADVVRMLLDAGADPNQLSAHNGNTTTPLIQAVMFGDEDIFSMLLTAGASPDTNPHESELIVVCRSLAKAELAVHCCPVGREQAKAKLQVLNLRNIAVGLILAGANVNARNFGFSALDRYCQVHNDYRLSDWHDYDTRLLRLLFVRGAIAGSSCGGYFADTQTQYMLAKCVSLECFTALAALDLPVLLMVEIHQWLYEEVRFGVAFEIGRCVQRKLPAATVQSQDWYASLVSFTRIFFDYVL